jgi:hypothetical protein
MVASEKLQKKALVRIQATGNRKSATICLSQRIGMTTPSRGGADRLATARVRNLRGFAFMETIDNERERA